MDTKPKENLPAITLNDDVVNTVKNLWAAIQSSVNEINSLRNTVANLNEKCAATDRLTIENEKITRDIEELREASTKVKADYEYEQNILNSRVLDYEERLLFSQEQNSKLDEINRSHQSTIHSINLKIEELEKENLLFSEKNFDFNNFIEQKNEYIGKINELNYQNEGLKTKLAEISLNVSDISFVQKEIARKNFELKEKADEIRDLKEKIAVLRNDTIELNKLKSQISDYQLNISNRDKDFTELARTKEMSDGYRNENILLKSKIEALNVEIARTHLAIEKEKSSKQSYQQNIFQEEDKAKAAENVFNQAIEDYSNQMFELKKQNAELEKALLETKDKNSMLIAKVNELMEYQKKIVDETGNISIQLNDKDAAIESLTGQIEKITSDIDALNAELSHAAELASGKDYQIDSLSKNYEELLQNYTNDSSELQQLREAVSKFEQKFNSIAEDYENIKKTSSENELKLFNSELELESLRKEIAIKSQIIKENHLRINLLESTNSALEAGLNSSDTSAADAISQNERINSLEMMIRTNESNVLLMESQLNDANNYLNQVLADLSEKQSDIIHLKAGLVGKQEIIESLTEKLELSREEVLSKETAILGLDTMINDLKEQIDEVHNRFDSQNARDEEITRLKNTISDLTGREEEFKKNKMELIPKITDYINKIDKIIR